MNTKEKKHKIKLGYEAKFIIILVVVLVGITLLYFGMEYTFKQISPQYKNAHTTQLNNQKAVIIEE